MKLFDVILWIILILFLNWLWRKLLKFIEDRIDATPAAPNYVPDQGVNEHTLACVPGLLDVYGIISGTQMEESMTLPEDICKFFNKYQRLRISCIIHLDRKFLAQTYDDNPDFIKIGLMSEEDDLLVKKTGLDPNVYIVGAEDSDPKNPELFATSFQNLLAIAWHDKERLNVN